ncbi:MAG: AMP-binding protein, partial [Bacteroidota bacterium]
TGQARVQTWMPSLRMKGTDQAQFLPIASQFEAKQSLEDHLDQVKTALKYAFKNQYYPLELIGGIEGYSNVAFEFEGVLASLPSDEFDLRFVIDLTQDQCQLQVVAQGSIFSKEALKDLLNHFEQLVSSQPKTVDDIHFLGNRKIGFTDFWTACLSDYVPLALFSDVPQKDHSQCQLPTEVASQLREVVRKTKVSQEDIFLASLSYLVKIISGQPSTLIGIEAPQKKRTANHLLGAKLAQLPLQHAHQPNVTVADFLQQMTAKREEMQAFDGLWTQDLLQLTRGNANSLEVAFTYAPDSTIDTTDLPSNQLLCAVRESADSFDIQFLTSTSLTSGLSMQYLMEMYVCILSFVCSQPTARMNACPYLSEAERNKILHQFTANGKKQLPKEHVIDVFRKQLAVCADDLAVAFKDRQWTFQEIETASNQWAHYLSSQAGFAKGTLIGVMIERSDWIIPILLGILKAGAVYLPLDPLLPKERIDFILADSKCNILIDDASIEEFKNKVDKLSANGPERSGKGSDLAYVFYTSGSTGKPKGVAISHASLSAFIDNLPDCLALSEMSCMGSLTNFTFDVSLLEIFGALLHGKTLHLFSNEDKSEVLQKIKEKAIDAVQLTPSRLEQLRELDDELFQTLSSLQLLVLGGEAMRQE